MMYLIINADDAGYSDTRDKGILELAKQSHVSDVSVMVNGENFEKFMAAWKADGHSVPGIHLNITEGKPLSDTKTVPSLVSPDGFMFFKNKFVERLSAGLVNIREVELEIRAQVGRFVDTTGVFPSHFDGHQHVHVMPGLAEVFARVLKSYGILRTRIPDQDIPDETVQYASFLKKIRSFAIDAAPVYKQFGITFPPAFVGLTTMGCSMTLDRLQQCLVQVVKAGSSPCELMVHPGYCCRSEDRGCGNGADKFSRSPDREHEMQMLRSAKFASILTGLDMTLTNFATALPI